MISRAFTALAPVSNVIDSTQPIIKGASLISMGAALGHNSLIDETTLEQCLAEIKRQGAVKIKFNPQTWNHGDGSVPGLVRADTCYIKDGKLRGDIEKMVGADENTWAHFKHAAENLSKNCGLSIDFDGTDELINGIPYARCSNLMAATLVDSPAANSDGMFGRMFSVLRKLIGFDYDDSEARDDDGKWTGDGGGSGGKVTKGGETLHPVSRDEKGTLRHANGDEVEDHIKAAKIAPSLKNVFVNKDPNGKVIAQGEDSKGRVKRTYNKDFTGGNAEKKYNRNMELIGKEQKIVDQNEANRGHEDKTTRENADALKLIHQTGIRPGSDTDTKAKVKAYGATTLEGRHVNVDSDGKVSLQFTGKKGVALNIPVEDKDTAKMLVDRKNSAGDNGKLFGTDDAKLRDYAHTLNGGSFKPKDFRTLKANNEAAAAMKSIPFPKTPEEYKKAVMQVAKHVSSKLGNTPTIALQSYINPAVFNEWQKAA